MADSIGDRVVVPDKNYYPRRLIALFWLLAIVLGAVQVLDTRATFIDPDGINYLDMGDAFFRGDWHTAISSLWPPLYAWLIGLVMFILKPSPFWEFSVVRLVNFVIYLFTLGCFHFFLLELIRYHQQQTIQVSSEGGLILPKWAWLALGYTLFIWSSLSLITILEDSPDMGVAAQPSPS